jgi:hypothetical protein
MDRVVVYLEEANQIAIVSNGLSLYTSHWKPEDGIYCQQYQFNTVSSPWDLRLNQTQGIFYPTSKLSSEIEKIKSIFESST